MPLDLLVCDLLPLPRSPENPIRLPAIERWLARADSSRSKPSNAVGWLAHAFGQPSPAPVAAVALVGEGASAGGAWLRADPVHLRVEQDAVLLHDPAVLDLDDAEAEALVSTLNDHFRGDALEFSAKAPDRWYVSLPVEESPTTVTLDDALGRNVFGMLPRGGGRINWPSALTEVQMLFAAHDVNRRRESEGRPLVNSVWFWGAGVAAAVARPYARVHTNEPYARGLAMLSGADAAAVPAAIDELGDGRESVLVVLDGLTAPRRSGDQRAWQALARSIDTRWFSAMPEALARFRRVRVLLPTGGDTLVATLTPGARWRWWRTAKPLANA
ncbi:MAG TPA: hypothetical protein VEC19_19195 [Usitatibacter sp.]|nr:hypothetical protein [Usitatibacter sp.]